MGHMYTNTEDSVPSVPSGDEVLKYMRRGGDRYKHNDPVLVPYTLKVGSGTNQAWYKGRIISPSDNLAGCFDVCIPECDEVLLNIMGDKLIDMSQKCRQDCAELNEVITQNKRYLRRANRAGVVPYKIGLYLGK